MRPLALMLLLTAGCDALAGSDYAGEPLISLSGSFAIPAGGASDASGGVVLLWQDAAGAGGPGVATTALPIATAPPARFTAAVPVTPPATARFQLGGIELAEAYVYLVADPAAPRMQPRGLDRTHALIYASSDVPAGSLAADYLGGPVAAGYHLRAFAVSQAPGAGQQQMIARCAASGARATACAARRAYQLAPIADSDALVVEVAPP